MITVLIVACIGAVLSAVVGTVWYGGFSPMGKLHMKSLGFDQLSLEEQQKKIEEAKPQMPKMYGLQMLLSFMTAGAVAFIITMSMKNGVSLGIALSFVVMNWLCFMVPVIGSSILWSNCDRALAFKKFLSDSGSYLVTTLLVGVIASFFV
jgi:hypothetical protein